MKTPEKNQEISETPDHGWLLLTINSALRAGKAILEIYQSDYTVSVKADQSPLTAADLAAHKIITEDLRATGIPVISEEANCPAYDERCDWSRFWMVDPLDGTKEFIGKNGEFTVNIALIEEGKPVMGVIYAPVPDELYFASGSLGAWKTAHASQVMSEDAVQKAPESEKLHQVLLSSVRLPVSGIKQGFVAVCSRRHMNAATYDLIRKIHPETDDIHYISRGSSLKFCAVAEGSADLYPRMAPTMEWDSAAGQAIAEISGCRVLNALTLQPLIYNKRELLNPSFLVVRD